jgi:nicotinamidase/pyrazinamidase
MSIINPADVRTTDAYMAIDVLPTFMPGGGLAVKEGDQIVTVVAKEALAFSPENRIAVVEQHPDGHVSFAESYVGLAPMTMLTEEMFHQRPANFLSSKAAFTVSELEDYIFVVKQQMLWPVHGRFGDPEAALHPYLVASGLFPFVFHKGMDPACDSYSAFFDNRRRPTHLGALLRGRGIKRIFMTGLALDYCVGWTCLDAADLGFEVVLLINGTRPVADATARTMVDQLVVHPRITII